MIYVHTGPMCSGKSLHLIKTAINIEEDIICIKPATDIREKDVIKSRRLNINIKAKSVKNLNFKVKKKNILIDECQFFDRESLISFVLNHKDKNIHLYGLIEDSNQKEFGYLSDLTGLLTQYGINFIHKHHLATCYKCGTKNKANHTIYNGIKDKILIGYDGYYPICDDCV